MPVFNKYSYAPLSGSDMIRLIVLDPSTDEVAPLTCQIIEQQTAAQHSEIRCNGDVTYLRITPHLDTLLRSRRSPVNRCHLWIDAICLNQDDEMEKAQQVLRMGNIYRKALEVDLWLGLENHMTAKLFAFFRKLSRLPDVTKWKTQWEMAGRIVFLMKKYIHHLPPEALGVIVDFFNQPWFSRRWVIQEACLARHATVHCGSQSIPLPLLSLAAIRFQRMDLSDYAIKVAASLCSQTTQLSMMELLWNFHEAACLEPKDRIAALFSLVPDSQRFHLDYTKHWTEIYKDFASFTYGLGNNETNLQLLLHLFEFGPVSWEADASYPSWVPDWSYSRRRRLPYHSRIQNPDTYELYPKSPGYSDKALVDFYQGSLQISWDVSITGPRGHRVAFAAKLDSFQQTPECKAEQVLGIFEQLFPSIPDAKLGMITLASLLKKISDFRHPIVKREATGRSLGRYERKLCKYHPDLNCQQLLIWLRTLESTLQDFCLVELELQEQNPVTGRSYGIGTELMQVDDLLIPLWSLESDTSTSKIHAGILEMEIRLSTMLAVRCIGEHLSGVPGGDRPVQVGRIIGPVTFVSLRSRVVNDNNRLTGARQDGGMGCK